MTGVDLLADMAPVTDFADAPWAGHNYDQPPKGKP